MRVAQQLPHVNQSLFTKSHIIRPPINQLQMPGSAPGLASGYAPMPAPGTGPGRAPSKLPTTGPYLTFERQLVTGYSSLSPPINSEGTDQNQVPLLQNGTFCRNL